MLVAGERGGALAKTVFMGLGVGAFWKALSWIVQIFPTAIGRSIARTGVLPNATLNVDISPEYMGVGYVIGPRIAGVMFAGGVLSWLVLLPLFSIIGNYLTVPFPPVPASGLRIDQMTPGPALERLHPLHRRRRRARRRADHARPHHPDDRVVVPRQHPRLQRQGRRRAAACPAPSATCR